MEQRLKHLLKGLAEIIAIGLVYTLFVSLTHLSIPCPFRLITGFRCPGCGVTHYCLAMLRLDLSAAFRANPFLFCLAPPALLYGLYRAYVYVRYDRLDYSLTESILLGLVALGAIVFAVLRNCAELGISVPLPGFSL